VGTVDNAAKIWLPSSMGYIIHHCSPWMNHNGDE